MSKLAGLSEAQGLTLAGIAAVAVAAGGAWYSGVFSRLGDATEIAAPAPVAQSDGKTADVPQSETVATAGGTAASKAAPIAPETNPEMQAAEPGAPAGAEAEAADARQAPGLDLVRVEADGSTMVAGRAEPGTEVAIEVDGQEVSRAAVAGDGSFVQFLDLPPSEQPRMVQLRAWREDGTGRLSDGGALIAPTLVPVAPQAGGDEVVAAASSEAAAEPSDKETSETPGTGAAPVAEAGTAATAESGTVAAEVAALAEPEAAAQAPVQSDRAEAAAPVAVTEPVVDPGVVAPAQQTAEAPVTVAPRAPVVVMTDSTGVAVVQTPAAAASATPPEVMSAVALDTISYSETGEVELTGRGLGHGFVRVYVDNRPVTTSRIAADGNWRTGLPDVDTGVYTLRVDQLDDAGQVVSRVETPFKREAQDVVVEAGQVKAITVQPGNTLWAIARETYGDGLFYVRLFEANRDRIRNPDLIYPGQVFDIPRE